MAKELETAYFEWADKSDVCLLYTSRIFEQTSVDVREDGFVFITFDILVRSFRLSGLAPDVYKRQG